MLLINDKKYKITRKEVKLICEKYMKVKGYSLLVSINFDYFDKESEKPGFIYFYVDFIDEKNINFFENRKYNELPTNLNSKINCIEIFDMVQFHDFIDSDVLLEFGKIKDNKIPMTLHINDELIKINFNDLVDIQLG